MRNLTPLAFGWSQLPENRTLFMKIYTRTVASSTDAPLAAMSATGGDAS